MNNAYEQAVAGRDKARTELQRVENEVQQVQEDYERLNTTPMATAAPHHNTEQERNRMAQKLTLLVQERSRWLKSWHDSEHAMQRELERRVHELHGERVHQENMREQASTPEAAQQAEQSRDRAQSELDRHEEELKTMQDKN
jgi:hypothetical protein